MATSASDGDSSDYGYDFTAEDEELIADIIDRVSCSQAPPAPPVPAVPPPSTSAPDNSPPPSVIAALQGLTEDDLAFDIGELESNFAPTHHCAKPSIIPIAPDIAGNDVSVSSKRRLSPSVAGDHEVGLASYVSEVKAHHTPTVAGPADVRYPDISRALSSVVDAPKSLRREDQPSKTHIEDKQSPLRRFRSFPKKPFSVSDLTAGSWCELQYFYTLTRLPGGKKTRTAAMKRGSDIHEKLEREVYTPVEIEISKRVDVFGLKIWNIIQGLRILRDTGLTRELEVWGVVDGNVVNGIIDGLSYNNPDPELEEDVVSSRGGSQSPPNSQPKLVSEFFPTGTPADKLVYITDVKTRASISPPSKPQVRGTIIQLFLYHRFLSDMASDKLDYINTFERYGLDPDDTFSDVFMAQVGALRDEIFGSSGEDRDSSGTWCSGTSDSEGSTDFVSAVSSSSKLRAGLDDKTQDLSETLKYRTLRALMPLLKFEIQLTFPKGASSVGQIVAVEYRYRQRGPANSEEDGGNAEKRRNGSVICTNTHFVEPEILDLYLKDDMQWWRGEREPRGVSLDEAFKCRSCEFVDTCEWRDNLDQEALRKARKKGEAKLRKMQGTPPAW